MVCQQLICYQFFPNLLYSRKFHLIHEIYTCVHNLNILPFFAMLGVRMAGSLVKIICNAALVVVFGWTEKWRRGQLLPTPPFPTVTR
jgi:hypothetical protein